MQSFKKTTLVNKTKVMIALNFYNTFDWIVTNCNTRTGTHLNLYVICILMPFYYWKKTHLKVSFFSFSGLYGLKYVGTVLNYDKVWCWVCICSVQKSCLDHEINDLLNVVVSGVFKLFWKFSPLRST